MGHTQQHLWLLTVPTPAAWLILSLKLRFFVRCFIVCFFLYTAAADKIAHLDLPICWIHVTCGCHFLRLQGCFLLNQPQFNLWTCLIKVEQILGGSLFSLTHTLSHRTCARKDSHPEWVRSVIFSPLLSVIQDHFAATFFHHSVELNQGGHFSLFCGLMEIRKWKCSHNSEAPKSLNAWLTHPVDRGGRGP